MAATTSLSRIVLCNTATVCFYYIWFLCQGRRRRDRPGAGNPPPLSSEFPAAGQPPLAPRSYEARDRNPPTLFPEKVFPASLRPAVDVAEEVGQPRDHRLKLGAGERGHVGVRHQHAAHPRALGPGHVVVRPLADEHALGRIRN